jgi:hypothetical protein
MPRSEQGTVSGELHVVLNWFGEVTARTQSASARHRRPSRNHFARWPSLSAAPQAAAAEPGIREVLQRYSAALESLDADAVKKVQPSIPADNLAKAFKDMRELKVTIDEVRLLSADATTARVSCRVKQALTPKAGSKQTTAVTRVMRLRREADSWVIDAFER